MAEATVDIDYTNWRGERSARHIQVIDMRFGSTDWHPKEQWLVRAVDIDKGEEREFAMDDIHSWKQRA